MQRFQKILELFISDSQRAAKSQSNAVFSEVLMLSKYILVGLTYSLQVKPRDCENSFPI
jgi:hypothetical protein